MSSEMSHAPYRDLLPQYAAGALTDTQRREVAAHLAGCADCRAELADWQPITGELRRGLIDLPPDSGSDQAWNALHGRIAPISPIFDQRSSSMSDTLETFSDAPVMALPPPTRQANRRRFGFLSVAAVMLIAVMSVVLFGVLQRAGTSTQGATKATPTSNPGCTNTAPSQDVLPHYTSLLHLSMVSSSEGWAVGTQQSDLKHPMQGVIYHLQDCRWQQYPMSMPQTWLTSISMASPTEGWAVGSLLNKGLRVDLSDLIGFVVLHYSNGQWKQVTIPNTKRFVIGTIDMYNTNDGWMIGVGTGVQLGNGTNTHPDGVLHYQDGAWSPAQLPASIASTAFSALTPVGKDDVWFTTESAIDNNSIVHFAHGQTTTYTLPPNIGVDGLAFPSSNDGWLVGRVSSSKPLMQQAILMHFDGVHWTNMPVPASFSGGTGNPIGSYFDHISLASSQEGFITSFPPSASSNRSMSLYHLHQGQWRVEQLPLSGDLVNAEFWDIKMVSPGEAWALLDLTPAVSIGKNTFTTGTNYSLIYHYADGKWSVFER